MNHIDVLQAFPTIETIALISIKSRLVWGYLHQTNISSIVLVNVIVVNDREKQ